MSTKTVPQMDIHNVLETDCSSGHRRRRKLWIVVVCLAVAVLLLVVMRLSAKKDGQTQYKTQEVTRGNLMVLVTATGTLQPTNTVSVGGSGLQRPHKSRPGIGQTRYAKTGGTAHSIQGRTGISKGKGFTDTGHRSGNQS